jgi:hypothetical protein
MATNNTIAVFHALREISGVQPVELTNCAIQILEELGQHCEWNKLLCIIDIFAEYPESGKSRRWILKYLPENEQWTQQFLNGTTLVLTEAHIQMAIHYHNTTCHINHNFFIVT